MTTERVSAELIRELVSRHTGRPASEIDSGVSLGAEGFGLDSIALAELLLEIQDRFGIEAMPLLDGSDITVRRLLEHVGAAGGA